MNSYLPTLSLLASVTLLVSCISDQEAAVAEPVQPIATPIQLPVVLGLDRERNGLINEAVRLAASEPCSGFSERLSGTPTRILVALTNSASTSRLISPEAVDNFYSGPGGVGAPTVWVAAIEGVSVPTFGEDPWNGSYMRAFVFVIDTRFPRLTGCVVRDAPMAKRQDEALYGSFEFEVLFKGQ